MSGDCGRGFFFSYELLPSVYLANKNYYDHNHRKLPQMTSFISRYRLQFIVALALVLIASPCLLAGNAPAQSDQSKEPEPQPLIEKNIGELTPKITDLSMQRLNMLDEFLRLQRVENLQIRLDGFSQERDEFKAQIDSLVTDLGSNRGRLTTIQSELNDTLFSTDQLSNEISRSLDAFDKWIDFWIDEEEAIADWESGLGPAEDLPSVHNQIDRLIAVIDEAQSELDSNIAPFLAMQEEAGKVQVSLHQMDLEIGALFAEKFNFSQRNAPFFSPEYFNQFDASMVSNLEMLISDAFQPEFAVLQHYLLQILLCAVLFMVIANNLNQLRPLISQSGRWEYLATHPYLVSALLSFTALAIMWRHIDVYWFTLLSIMLLVCLYILKDIFLKDSFAARVIGFSLILLLVLYILRIVQVPRPVERLFIVMISVAVFSTALRWYILNEVHQARLSRSAWGYYLIILVSGVSFISELRGNSDLSFFLVSSSLKTIFALLLIWCVYRSMSGLFSVNLRYSRFANLSKYADRFADMISPLLKLIGLAAALVCLLVVWQVHPNFSSVFQAFSDFGMKLGTTRISLNVVVTALTFLYLSYWAAKLVEIALLEGMLIGKSIDRGVKLTIAKFLGYAIIFVGIIGTLLILGINLTNITILGSAIAVGIGFGLQTIFNNFASGLILLFERPIKVGDVILVGEEIGTVRELGLRATVVETYDNAEIVVPNSTLTSTNVTNWTLGKRQVRVKVSIGVAYGSDIERVLEILKQCALEHPLVLSEPQPVAMFSAHGASSLDFMLYVYVPDISNRLITQSDLNQAINEALEEAGIEIPYPQSDLHLKTVSKEVQEFVKEQ